ncbi:extracellular solute-binding protein [Tritonibacter scottomollicae]|uniref:Microcin C transport system substrate-binding protein n=1 Tax=Tritonibacter scottomollicae TaxID=483013 RepID=A0A2T1AMX5_TRISK|nr:extracellular solute-binding protein [Tritonibacter scottomollicae]PRZ49912.1 microcin C transport system substrate-binding protein [Tritonibacter scottomollicae]
MTIRRVHVTTTVTAKSRDRSWIKPLASAALLSAAALLTSAVTARSADEADVITSHGYSFYGDLDYPADFTHFDYVNPEAPKGGELAISFIGTLDSMNPYSGKGRAHAFSVYPYESLLADAAPADKYGQSYCLLCKSVEYPEDKSWVIFHMRPEAKFSDGTPVTAHDIAFSHNLLLDQGLKSYADAVRKRIPKVEVIDDHTIKFYFADGISRRSLIEQVGGVPAWSKKWFDETGQKLSENWIEGPPGSGPYVIDEIDLSRRLVLKRNPDYWGKDLPVNQGRHNFDTLRVEIFADDTAAFEAFKAGEYTFRAEGDSKKWASGYDFPKVDSGAVKLEELPNGAPPSPSGIIFNLASPDFQDRRVREALALAFNFEWSNESLLYGLFERRASFTQNSPLMATGVPEGAERAFLDSLGDLVPSEMLEEEVYVPVTSEPSRLFDRRNARKAAALLEKAGYPVGSDGKRVTPEGAPFELDFLFSSSSSPTTRGVMENFVNNLESLGVAVNFEVVDTAQYTSRERARDYDLVVDSYTSFLGTGTGLAQRFGSEAAEYSLFNPAGLASPLIDSIIEESLRAETREEEVAIMTALDRALRHEFIMIPLWYNPDHWVAYYDQFEHPAEIPPYSLGYLDFWWYNEDKAKALRDAGALR